MPPLPPVIAPHPRCKCGGSTRPADVFMAFERPFPTNTLTFALRLCRFCPPPHRPTPPRGPWKKPGPRRLLPRWRCPGACLCGASPRAPRHDRFVPHPHPHPHSPPPHPQPPVSPTPTHTHTTHIFTVRMFLGPHPSSRLAILPAPGALRAPWISFALVPCRLSVLHAPPAAMCRSRMRAAPASPCNPFVCMHVALP
jgi:hypothetical protein